MSEERLARIESKLDVGLDELRAGQQSLDQRLTKVEINQEAMRDDIKLIAEGHEATQILIKQCFVALHAKIDTMVDPYVKTVQNHSAILAAHDLKLPWAKP